MPALTGYAKTVDLSNRRVLQITISVDGLTNLFTRDNIVSIDPVKLQDYSIREFSQFNNIMYRYSTQTCVDIILTDGRNLDLELQDITNQPTWSTGNQAGIDQAVADLLAWLNSNDCFWDYSGCFWSQGGCFWN